MSVPTGPSDQPREDPYATPPGAETPPPVAGPEYGAPGAPEGGYGTPPAYAPPAYGTQPYGTQPYGAGGGVGGPVTPSPVRTVAILLYIGAGFAFLGALFGFVATSVNALFLIFAVILLAIGIAYIVLAGRLKKADRTARLVTVVLVSIGIVSNLATIGRNPIGSLVGIALSAVIIYLLMFNVESKRFFGDPV